MLSEYKNGYNEAKDKWSEISFLYDKIVKFVKTRLTLRYKDLIKGEGIPAHLLGKFINKLFYKLLILFKGIFILLFNF